MAIKTYTKGQKTQLSNNFTSMEFDCKGNGCCSSTLIDEKLVQYLQKIRDHFGKSVGINSGYRCKTHNARVGGASKSNHMDGEAADIRISGVAPIEVAKYAEYIGVKGIGVYSWGVHIDTRTSKYFWYDGGESNVKTFGQPSNIEEKSTTTSTPAKTETITNPPKNTTTTTSVKTLSFGSSGSAVRKLQEDLASLGYDCGKIDGLYGSKTKTQVIKFQQKVNIKDDGVAGPITLAKIEEAKKSQITENNNKTIKYKVTASLLNIRSGPSTNNSIIGKLPKGSIVEIVTTSSNWGQLFTGGWVCSDYLQVV